MDAFTAKLWTAIEGDVVPRILAHPFIKGLTSGDLPEAAFRQYVQQDSAYLEAFGRGLALLAAKAPENATFMMFCEHARNTLIVEEALHREFMQQWGDAEQHRRLAWYDLAPEPLLYTSFLTRVAHERPFHEAVAAFLPCYWIYQHVGERLAAAGSPQPLYQRWIDTYSGEAFAAVVREMLAVVDACAADLSSAQQQPMIHLFRRASQLELLFWDSAYRLSGWPFEC